MELEILLGACDALLPPRKGALLLEILGCWHKMWIYNWKSILQRVVATQLASETHKHCRLCTLHGTCEYAAISGLENAQESDKE